MPNILPKARRWCVLADALWTTTLTGHRDRPATSPMTLESIVDARIALLSEVLFDYGYDPVQADAWPGDLALRAVRRVEFNEPRVAITVAEAWQTGPDPEKLRPTEHGCHLLVCSWHAQIATGDVGAERLDIDPTKPAKLRVHAHPFGQPNASRVPTRFRTVEQWLEIVERRLIGLADPTAAPAESALYPAPPGALTSAGRSRPRKPRRRIRTIPTRRTRRTIRSELR